MIEFKSEASYYDRLAIELKKAFPSLKNMKCLKGYRHKIKLQNLQIENVRSIEFDILFFNEKRAVSFEIKICREGNEWQTLGGEVFVRSRYCDKCFAVFVNDGNLGSTFMNIAYYHPFSKSKSETGCVIVNASKDYEIIRLKGAMGHWDQKYFNELLTSANKVTIQKKLKSDDEINEDIVSKKLKKT